MFYRGADRREAELVLDTPAGAVAPGQAAVLYDGERLLGGHPHHIEPQRLAAALLHPQNGLGGVIEREALRCHEGKAELGMQEVAAAHQAFARIVAVDHAVDGGEIRLPLALAGARRPELARARLRVLDPLGRRRMAGEKVGRARLGAAGGRLEIGVALHVGEEA